MDLLDFLRSRADCYCNRLVDFVLNVGEVLLHETK